ncbi:MAG: mechanosensitive ion channel family protein [Cytophagales bacterium]|jgi:small-conductance mechanosensitive channel|nr:mechanosensitive ion channel family protein [Cytophagales bacterium]
MFKNFIHLLNQGNSWYALITIAIASVITYVILKIKNSTQNYKNKKGGKLLAMVVNSSFVSLIILVWLNLFVDRNNFLLQFLGTPILDIIMKIKSISTIWLLWLCLSRLVQQLQIEVNNNEILGFIKDKSMVRFISKILITIIYIIMASLVMNVLGMSIDKIFTLLGGSAVLIGFGAKSIIERSLAGFFIKVNGKFTIGDLVHLPDKNIMGKVIEIGMTSTKVLMIDQQTIIIPNETFNAVSFINASKSPCRCVNFDINVPSKFSDDAQTIVQQLKNVFEKLEIVQSTVIVCSDITKYSIESRDWFVIINVMAFLKTKDFGVARSIRSQLLTKAMAVVNLKIRQDDKFSINQE